jgi:hypothetical protein
VLISGLLVYVSLTAEVASTTALLRISLRIHQHGWALTVFLVAVVRSASQQMPMRLGARSLPL